MSAPDVLDVICAYVMDDNTVRLFAKDFHDEGMTDEQALEWFGALLRDLRQGK